MYAISALREFCAAIGCEYFSEEPMSRHTTFKIGGPAELLALPSSTDMLRRLLCKCRELDIPVTVVGRGSNLLVSDGGIDGCVVCLGAGFSNIRREDGLVVCSAGTSLTELCRYALANGLTGLEFAYGIPGSVGGAVYMNAGAYGGELKDAVVFSRHLTPEGEPVTLGAEQLGFGYRRSVYTGMPGCIIVEAGFRLLPGDPEAIRARMDDLMGRRRAKQPVELPSAGSVFKRPEGAFAGALIEKCGLKGRAVGGAVVSEKHAGFIVNTGGATCRDVETLVRLIQDEVREKTGFTLECEIKRTGKTDS